MKSFLSKKFLFLVVTFFVITNFLLGSVALAKKLEISEKDVQKINTALDLAKAFASIFVSEGKIKTVLNNTIKGGQVTTDVTYGLLVLSALNEMELVDMVVSQKYKTEAAAYFNQILDERTSLISHWKGIGFDIPRVISGQITGPMAALTLNTFAITNKTISIFVAFQILKQEKLYDGLWYYFDLRAHNEPHSVAWDEAKEVMGFAAISNPLGFGKKRVDKDYTQLEAQFAALWEKWGSYVRPYGIAKEAKEQLKGELRGMVVEAAESQKFVEEKPKPSLADQIKSGWNNLLSQLEKIANLLKNSGQKVKAVSQSALEKIKSTISQLSPFGAGIIPTPEPTPPTPIQEIAQVGPVQTEEVKEKAEKMGLTEIQERIDDISEMVDVLNQEMAGLGQVKPTTGGSEKIVEISKSKETAKPSELAPTVQPKTQEETEISQPKSPIVLTTKGVPTPLPKILISEVCAGWDKAENEFIELYNPNDLAVVLNNGSFELRLVDSQNRETSKRISWFQSSIPARGYFLLVAGEIAENQEKIEPDAIYSGQLTSSSGVILVDKNYGRLIDKVSWGSQEKPPPLGALEGTGKILEQGLETGQSLARIKKENDLVDTDNNSQDFALESFPNPTNSRGETLTKSPALEASPQPESGPEAEGPEAEGSEAEESGPNFCSQENLANPSHWPVIFNEIAWMGSRTDWRNEWLELKNLSAEAVSLVGWQILDKDEDIKIVFGKNDLILANGFYLLEKTNDNSVPGILADKIYTGWLNNKNETLRLFDKDCQLIDEVIASPDWPAGSNSEKRTMERTANLNWQTFSGSEENGILGTPRAENSQPGPEEEAEAEEQEQEEQEGGEEEGIPEESLGDETPPEVNFEPLSPIQNSLYFTLSWSGQDLPAPDLEGLASVTPSGIDAFYLKYDFSTLEGVTPQNEGLQYLEGGSWIKWLKGQILKIKENLLNLFGQDETTYIFQIQAKDKAGNESQWKEISTKISLPKAILEIEPEKLEFEATEFGQNPESQKIVIKNLGEAILEWESTLSANWISLSLNSGQVLAKSSSEILVSLDISGMPTGQYQTKILIFSENQEKEIFLVLNLQPDISPPETYLDSKGLPSNPTNSTQAQFHFFSNEKVYFQCSLSSNPPITQQIWEVCRSPKKYQNLAEGNYQFQVRAIDYAGNPDLTPANYSWLIDITPPSVVFSLLPFQTDLSFEISFEITDEGGLVSGLAGFTFRFREEGLTWQEEEYQEILGAPEIFSEKRIFTGEDGKTYYFQIRVEDQAGNESQWLPEIPAFSKISLPKPSLSIVINEIGWMGTKANPADEWIELYNNTDLPIDLSGWQLISSDGGPEIIFVTGDKGESKKTINPVILAKSFYLIERTDDKSTSESADWLGSFGNGLGNNPNCEVLSLYDQNNNLIDQTVCLANGNWPAGKASPDYISMERINSKLPGSDPGNWANNNRITRNGRDSKGNLINGTPKSENSVSKAKTYLNSRSFDEDLTLTFLGSPYIFSGYFDISQNATLEIEPGVIIKFDYYSGWPYSSINVYGKLLAKGTQEKPIVFTSYFDDDYGGDTNENGPSAGQAGNWRQITFLAQSQGELENVVFRYGSIATSWSGWCDHQTGEPMLKIKEAKVSFEGVTIEKARCVGLAIENSEVKIENSNFQNLVVSQNSQPAALFLRSGDLTIKNSNFKGNYRGFYSWSRGKIVFEGNYFQGNQIPFEILLTDFYPRENTMANNDFNGFKIIGDLAEDLTLRKDLPYVVSNLLISEGKTLNIEPGVIFKFEPEGYLEVKGKLLAQGNSAEKIVFTSISDDESGGDTNNDGLFTSPGPGNWHSLFFRASSENSILDNVIARYGGLGGWSGRAGQFVESPAIYVENAKIEIKNSIIEKNRYKGLKLKDSDSTIENTIFREHQKFQESAWVWRSGYALYLENSNPSLINCHFENNNYGIYVLGNCPDISNVTFEGNYIDIWPQICQP